MDFVNFEIKPKHILIVIVLGVLSGIGQYECNDWKAGRAREAEEAQAREEAQEAQEDREEKQAGQREAARQLDAARMAAASEASQAGDTALDDAEDAGKAEP